MRKKVRPPRLDSNGVKFIWRQHTSKRGHVYWRRMKFFFFDLGDYRRRP